MADLRHSVVDSPLGPVLLTASDRGLSGLHFATHGREPHGERDDAALAPVAEQLAQWFAGDRTEFDLALDLVGTPFQQRVWALLQTVPYATTTTYGELAARLGDPGASRAVGLANGRNPVSVVVPCHRVVGADGSLTGYGGGLAHKRWLLDHELRCSGTALF